MFYVCGWIAKATTEFMNLIGTRANPVYFLPLDLISPTQWVPPQTWVPWLWSSHASSLQERYCSLSAYMVPPSPSVPCVWVSVIHVFWTDVPVFPSCDLFQEWLLVFIFPLASHVFLYSNHLSYHSFPVTYWRMKHTVLFTLYHILVHENLPNLDMKFLKRE
jgi:hypothetical protein